MPRTHFVCGAKLAFWGLRQRIGLNWGAPACKYRRALSVSLAFAFFSIPLKHIQNDFWNIFAISAIHESA
jgi:hypothetical protein